jgi:RNA polymerase sigma-54 factor
MIRAGAAAGRDSSMRFDTSQHMRLSQQMKLAPRMIQSMEILQMPMMALQERIEQELESNIALEVAEQGESPGEELAAPAEGEAAGSLGEREMVVGDDNSPDDWERLSDLESDYREAFDNEYSSQRYSPARAAGERDRKMDAMANVAARREGLTEQLLQQWSFAEVDPEVAALGARIIAYIDQDGLLGADLDTILDQNRTIPGVADVTREKLERALGEVQLWLDPPGVGARDLRECVLLQIEALQSGPGPEDWSDVRLLIESHFDDVVQNRLPRIAHAANIPLERVQRAVEMMARLKLRPGRELVDEEVPPVVPDVIVEYDEVGDEYTARLSDGTLPTLCISRRYAKMARDRAVDRSTRSFVTNAVRNASWLIDSIQQRKHTLLRVVNAVLARQRAFFESGPKELRPLPMVEVADQLGIHVGTVSRAVADKWMQTPRGIVPLRMFFSGGRETDSGRDMSWEAVRATLKEIIDQEDRHNPLSDEALAAALKDRGIDLARRTVVKYRQQMDIPPARRRKVFGS